MLGPAPGKNSRDRTADFHQLALAYAREHAGTNSAAQQHAQQQPQPSLAYNHMLPPSAQQPGANPYSFGPAPATLALTSSLPSSDSSAFGGLSPRAAAAAADNADPAVERARAFNRAARAIATGMVLATERIERLTALVRSRAPFSDASAEISRLTVDIKQDLLSTSRSIDSLGASLAAAAAGGGSRQQQAVKNSQQIVNDLKVRLADQSKAFGDLLIQRSQHLRDQSDRRGAFEHAGPGGGGGAEELRHRGLSHFGKLRQRLQQAAGGAAGGDSLGAGAGDGTDTDTGGAGVGVTGAEYNEEDGDAESGGLAAGRGVHSRLLGAPGQQSHTGAAGSGTSGRGVGLPAFTALLSSSSGGYGGGDTTASENEGSRGGSGGTYGHGGVTQTLVERGAGQRNEYLASRAAALKTIQSTTEEVASMYKRLNMLVLMQEEMTMRIDSTVDETMINVEEGHNELLKYLDGLSSNQWLIIKVFAVVIAFAILFVTVLA